VILVNRRHPRGVTVVDGVLEQPGAGACLPPREIADATSSLRTGRRDFACREASASAPADSHGVRRLPFSMTEGKGGRADMMPLQSVDFLGPSAGLEPFLVTPPGLLANRSAGV
jgi:hypothetical protein